MKKQIQENPFKWESTPVFNFVNYAIDETERLEFFNLISKNLFAIHNALGSQSHLAFMKEKLGRQKFTWMRHHVWEGENWRVYVSKEGIAFEVRETLSLQEMFVAYDDFLTKIGIR